jgi:hypothetical protein
MLPAFLAAALVEAERGRRARATEVLLELESLPELRGQWSYPRHLPACVRLALELGQVDLATRLPEGVVLLTPLHRCSVRAAEAALAEARGDLHEATRAYRDAADRWRQFGHVPEEGFAELGSGRTLWALGRQAEAVEALRAAQAIFASLGAAPALAEVTELLADTHAAQLRT